MAAAKTTQVVALKSFECEVDDERILVRLGDVFRSDDPVIKGRTKLGAPVGLWVKFIAAGR